MEFTPLSAEQKQQFDEQGYLIVRGALSSDEISRLIEAGDRLIASDATENRQKMSGTYDGFRNCISMDNAFLPLLTHPKTMPLIAQLLGPNLHLVTSHLIYKMPCAPGTPATMRQPGWHRDIAGTPEDLGHAGVPRMEMKCAFYLTDLGEPNSGVTLFAPGSNHLKAKLQIPTGQSDPEGAVEPLLQAGDAVFFENRTWHAGAPNLSDRVAKMVMFGYGYLWLKEFDYMTQAPQLLEQTDDIGKQLLGGLKGPEGPEGRFVPGGISAPLRAWCKAHGVQYSAASYG